MACCGQDRAMASSGGRAVEARGTEPGSRSVLYQYTGATAMTINGPISGQQYRFSTPGSRLGIDPRDAESFAGVPNLRRIG